MFSASPSHLHQLAGDRPGGNFIELELASAPGLSPLIGPEEPKRQLAAWVILCGVAIFRLLQCTSNHLDVPVNSDSEVGRGSESDSGADWLHDRSSAPPAFQPGGPPAALLGREDRYASATLALDYSQNMYP